MPEQQKSGGRPGSPTIGRPPLRAAAWVVGGLLLAVATPPRAAAQSPPLPPPLAELPPRELAFDWVQIDSGEWLKGEIERLEDDVLVFDSEEFGDVSLDWEDVRRLVSRRSVSIRLQERPAVTGRIEMDRGIARIEADGGIQEHFQDRILALLPVDDVESAHWSGSASAGLSLRSGNTDQSDVILRAELARRTILTRWRSSYLGEFRTVDGDETANSHRAPSQMDVFLTSRFFLTTPFVEYVKDEFQNIGSRVTSGLGGGFELVDTSWVHFEAGTGVAHQYTDFVSVEAGEDASEHDAAVWFLSGLDFDLPGGVEWDHDYRLQLIFTDLGKTNHHLESVLSFDIWGPLEAQVSFIFDRVEDPVADDEGERPSPNDYRLTAGLGFGF